MGEIWSILSSTLILRPMLNVLVVLYWLLRSNFGLSIVVFTALVRGLTFPLTLKQMRSMKAQQELQPKIKELERKFSGDRERLTQEQMKLYKEHGGNPLGGCLPLLIQMPIWLGLYQSIYRMLGSTPEQLIDLYKQLYLSIPLLSRIAQEAVPFRSRFLWLDLARPDPLYILPILVAASSWLAQKLSPTTATGDSQQSSMTQSMQVFMPLMMGFMALQFPSGVAVYFLASNALQIVQQGFTTGWSGLPFKVPFGLAGEEEKDAEVELEPAPVAEAEGTRPPRRRKGRDRRKKGKRRS